MRFKSAVAQFRGDLSNAVRHGREAVRRDRGVPYVTGHLKDIYRTLGMPVDAQRQGREGTELFRYLNNRGDHSGLLREIRSAGGAIWKKGDWHIAALALGRARDWDQLERVFDAAGIPPTQLCWRYPYAGVPISIALHVRGRTGDAAQLLGCMQAWLGAHSRGSIRSPEYPDAALEFERAQLLALAGNRSAAVASFNRALAGGWRGVTFSPSLKAYPALDTLRELPELQKSEAELGRLLATERGELLHVSSAR